MAVPYRNLPKVTAVTRTVPYRRIRPKNRIVYGRIVYGRILYGSIRYGSIRYGYYTVGYGTVKGAQKIMSRFF